MRKYFLIIGVLLAVSSGVFFLRTKTHETVKAYASKISVGGKTLGVEIAKTPAEREKGLSGRESLCPDCGMLFEFDQEGIYYFWMPKMYFDIDILWIADNKVVDITYDAKKPAVGEDFNNPKERYFSKVPVDKVLEVNAGWAKENGIKIGDLLKI